MPFILLLSESAAFTIKFLHIFKFTKKETNRADTQEPSGEYWRGDRRGGPWTENGVREAQQQRWNYFRWRAE